MSQRVGHNCVTFTFTFLDLVSATDLLPLVASEVSPGLRKKPKSCCIFALSFYLLIKLRYKSWKPFLPDQEQDKRATSCPFTHEQTSLSLSSLHSIQCSLTLLLYLQIAPVRPHPQLVKSKQNQCPGSSVISLPLSSSPATHKTSVPPSSSQKQGKNPPYAPQLLGCPSQTSS